MRLYSLCPNGCRIGLLLTAAAVLQACGSAPTPAPAAPPVPHQAVDAGADCGIEGPRADYEHAGFAGLVLLLPPRYRPLHESEPGTLTNAALWIAPDSSLLFIGFDDSAITVDETVSVEQSEGRCRLTIADSAVWIELSRIVMRDGTDSVFGGRTNVVVDSLLSLDIAVLGRTRQERARLLGVLGTARTRR